MSSFPPPPPLRNSMDPVDPRGPIGPNQPVLSGKPDNYLVWAILATICCCLPTGIAAIVFAAQVDGKWAGGDYAGASEASEKAKFWSLVSLGLGVVGIAIYALLGAMGGMSSSY